MKKTFTIVSALLLSGLVSAQITLTSSVNGYQAGDAFTQQPCVADFNDLGASGANVTVDLSGLMDDGTASTASFVSASSTAQGSLFPSANVAQALTSTNGNAGYGYMNSNSSKVEMLGIYTSAYTMRFSNPQTLLSFPMNYLDSTNDDFVASYSANGVDVFRSGSVSTVADAYGSITTPSGTFPYLRLYTVQVLIDTFKMGGQIIGMSYSETYTYNYMGDNTAAPLYAYSEVYTGSGSLATASYAKNVFPTGTQNVANSLESTSVFPNPATTHATVQFTLKQANAVAVSVVDIHGKEVYTYHSSAIPAGEHRLNIETGALAKGIYSAIIKTGNEQQIVKFSVQ